AGSAAGIPDAAYAQCSFEASKARLLQQADVLLCVQPPAPAELALLPEHAIVVGLLQPFQGPEKLAALCKARVTALAMELVPRISRAQSMDALSSQAACAGYKAALLAASELDRFLP